MPEFRALEQYVSSTDNKDDWTHNAGPDIVALAREILVEMTTMPGDKHGLDSAEADILFAGILEILNDEPVRHRLTMLYRQAWRIALNPSLRHDPSAEWVPSLEYQAIPYAASWAATARGDNPQMTHHVGQAMIQPDWRHLLVPTFKSRGPTLSTNVLKMLPVGTCIVVDENPNPQHVIGLARIVAKDNVAEESDIRRIRGKRRS